MASALRREHLVQVAALVAERPQDDAAPAGGLRGVGALIDAERIGHEHGVLHGAGDLRGWRGEPQRGLQFIRNGEVHDATGAATHLRAKLERAGDRVQGVDAFIDGVASRSWLSGQPYRVRLADGRELAARDWLRAELIRLETAPVTR